MKKACVPNRKFRKKRLILLTLIVETFAFLGHTSNPFFKELQPKLATNRVVIG